jgi:hypothetical protein
MAASLFGTQGINRIDTGGSLGREEAGEQRHESEDTGHYRHGQWIMPADTEEQGREQPRQTQRIADAKQQAADGQGQTMAQHKPQDVPAAGAKCCTNADLTGSLGCRIGDAAANIIRKITPVGVVSTLAGTAGSVGSQDGNGSAARFNQPGGITIDSAGNLYVADTGNATIRRITAEGLVTTLAGSASSRGNQDGAGAAASFGSPAGITVGGAGNLYVVDTGNAVLRRVTAAGTVTTLVLTEAGAGTPPPTSTSSGGGGGGTMEAWFIGLLALLGAAGWWRKGRTN